MSNYSAISAGIVTILEAGITGAKAFDYPPNSPGNQFPTFVVLPEPVSYEEVISGGLFTAGFRIICLLTSADDAEGFRALYNFIDPTQANESVHQVIRDDPTLNGSVDSSILVRAENIGRREINGGFYFACDLILETIKTV